MKQQCQNIKSTKVKQNAPDNLDEEIHQGKPQAKLRDVYIKIYLASDTVHSNQTRCFPAISSSENKCIMVSVEIDRNYIDAEPMNIKTARLMIKVYLALWEHLTAMGIVKPTTHIMDDDASAEYKKLISKNCTIQQVPPNNHRHNLAKRAMHQKPLHCIPCGS
jgi:hypothetical protein